MDPQADGGPGGGDALVTVQNASTDDVGECVGNYYE